jgi:hypothetical protein
LAIKPNLTLFAQNTQTLCSKSYFVARLKKSVKFKHLDERELPENRHQHILVNEYIELEDEKKFSKYTKRLRRVVVWDEINQQTRELTTN